MMILDDTSGIIFNMELAIDSRLSIAKVRY